MAGLAPDRLARPPQSVIDAGLATFTVLDYVIESFLNAPVSNPDGSTGINLHIELDELQLDRHPFSAGWHDFDRFKQGHFGGPIVAQ